MCVVLMVSMVGTYSVSRDIRDIWSLILFGVIGYLLRKADYPLAPIVVGFVLGPIFEKNFRRTGLISQGDFVGFIADRPITLAVLALILVFLMVPIFRYMSSKVDRNAS
jgi:putative tricarboxylic transport membrane protein